jgi:hypothetical protein
MWPFTKPKDVSYGSPWEHRKELSYGYQPNDETVYPGLEPDWLGQFPKVVEGELEMVEPAVGSDLLYAVEIADSSGSQVVYTDVYPIITVREL